MTKPREHTLSISLRTLTWLGAVLFAFSSGVAAVVLVYTPPVTATLILLLTFVFLGTAGLGTALAALLLRRWHRDLPQFALFQGAMTGNFAVLVLLLQYFQALDWVTVFIVLLFVLSSEVVYYQAQRMSKPEPQKGRKKRKQTATKSDKEESTKKTLASQRPRRTTRVRKTKGRGR